MKVILANYGCRHAGMLLAHLYSLERNMSGATAAVYWQDMPRRLVDALESTFPFARFVKTAFDFAGDRIQRIASKTLCWAQAAGEHRNEKELLFADTDTVILRNPQPFFEGEGWDVSITCKPEKVPLNTGVMLVRGGMKSAAFLEEWRDETLGILKNPDRFAEANDSTQPYGAPDQMALYQMLAYQEGQSLFECGAKGQRVLVRAMSCSQLNETNSRPIDGSTFIIHYKGGWQQILLDGRPFSRFRPRRLSWEMFSHYQKNFLEALACLNSRSGNHYRAEELGIVVPWYFETDTGNFLPAHYAAWRLKEAAKRAWLLATGAL